MTDAEGAEYTGSAQSEYTRPGDPHPWHVFAFDSVTSSPEP
jgi:hypothetical protein